MMQVDGTPEAHVPSSRLTRLAAIGERARGVGLMTLGHDEEYVPGPVMKALLAGVGASALVDLDDVGAREVEAFLVRVQLAV